MNSYEVRISRALVKRVRDEIESRGTDIISGVCLRAEGDPANDYASRTGEIKALMKVLTWIEEIEREAANPEGDKNNAS